MNKMFTDWPVVRILPGRVELTEDWIIKVGSETITIPAGTQSNSRAFRGLCAG